MDNQERLRDELLKQIKERDRRIEENEEEMRNNIMSISEEYDKSFSKVAKKVTYNTKRTLSYYLNKNVEVEQFPLLGELKNNIDQNNIQTAVFDVIKKKDVSDYETMVKYKDQTTITKTYQPAFMYSFCCRGVVSVSRAYYVRHRYSDSCVMVRTNFFTVTKENTLLNFPKGELKTANLKKVNLEDVLETNQTIECKKEITNIYKPLKKYILKELEGQVAKMYKGKNYALTSAKLNNLSLNLVLIPAYKVHCSKPGFDIKYIINATNKTCTKYNIDIWPFW